MFRRQILRDSSCRQLLGRLRRRSDFQQAQPSPFISCKKFYSSTPESDKKGNGKYYVFFGSVVAVYAYQAGYMDQFFARKQPLPTETISVNDNIRDNVDLSSSSHSLSKSPLLDHENKSVSPEELPHVSNEKTTELTKLPNEETTELKRPPNEDLPRVVNEGTSQDKNSPNIFPPVRDEESTETKQLPNDIPNVKTIQNPVPQIVAPKDDTDLNKNKTNPETRNFQIDDPDDAKISTNNSTSLSEETTNLLNAYLLKEAPEENPPLIPVQLRTKNNDGKMVVDLLEAIHEAENRQAQLDAAVFAEEKRSVKDKYDKELRDLRARELMRTEEVALLEKELRREQAKAAAALRALEEELEANFQLQIEQKDKEVGGKIRTANEVAIADKTAAIALEKATQIKEMAETNLNIDALCMAFFARSEESRQIHSVHKLAVGTLAVNDALMKGLPLGNELDSLRSLVSNSDQSSLLHSVISTLPSSACTHGVDTLPQLIQKLSALKGRLRSAALIPAGGGGVVAYTLGYAASSLRIKDVGARGEGIESTLCKVEGFLAEGNVVEAADTLEEGVKGTEAEGIGGEWVARARNRAIAEQALSVLHSYTTALSLSH